jgi:hypothetical protein
MVYIIDRAGGVVWVDNIDGARLRSDLGSSAGRSFS